MKRTFVAAAGFALFAASGLANAASWSVFVEPGVYGRVAIGGYAEPPMVYTPQPVMAVDNGYGQVVEEVVDPAYATDQPPVYLWVPEYQRQHWAQYSREYGAVGVPVYFVDDGWYRANVMRRNWTPEQRSWSQQQWLEQDRLARDRFERRRFEQQRHEQQQRWMAQREWYVQQQQGRWNNGHGTVEVQVQGQIRWGSAQGDIPAQGGQGARPQPQPGGGQPPGNGQWQQAGNGGRPVGAGNGAPAGNAGYAGNGAYPGNGGNAGNPGNGGNPASGGYAGGNAYAGNGGNPGRGGYGGGAGQQPPAASQSRGDGRAWQGGGQNAGDRRGDDRGRDRDQRDERRAQPDRRGGFEHGRGGNGRDR